MPNYHHILLAADYSDHCHAVAAKAQSLAASYQAKLSIVHVLDNIAMPDTNYGTVIALNNDSGYGLLETEKAKFAKLAGLLNIADTNRWLIWGIPKQEICLLAEREKADLIVIGSSGRHGLALLLGSTANSVLHHANCDVLAVRYQNGN